MAVQHMFTFAQYNFASTLLVRVATMFATLGGEQFEEELLAGARNVTGCDHLGFFTFDAQGRLSTITA